MRNLAKLFGLALAALIGLSVTACPTNGGGGGDGFVAVASISGVPGVGLVGDIALNGTVNPGNATNKAITWAITASGMTQAAIAGNILTTQATGTVTVRATIRGGAAGGADYTQDFSIGIHTQETLPTVTLVTVDPATATVAKGGIQAFSATVAGTNNPEQGVTWTIDQTNKNAGTTINASGLLTVAASESLATLTVRAASTVDDTKSGTAVVTLTGGGGGPTSAPLGGTLTLSGQVYEEDSTTYTPIYDNLSVSSLGSLNLSGGTPNLGDIGGNGSVDNGQLSFTINTPTALTSAAGYMSAIKQTQPWRNLQISPSNTQINTLVFLQTTGSNNYNSLMRSATTFNAPLFTEEEEVVSYMYVDRDATYIETESSGSMSVPIGEGGTYTITMKILACNISLKQGWNAIYTKTVIVSPESSPSVTTIMSAANPDHLKWVARDSLWW